MPEAVAALESDDRVRVTADKWLRFEPADGTPSNGLIFYPGARIDPRSYAPFAHVLAAEGYLVVIPRMPLNRAVLAPERAAAVMDEYSGVTRWAVGGHSLGGAMAARFARRHPERVQALLLWAAYPAERDSLADLNLPVWSEWATNDGLATPEKQKATRHLLPVRAAYGLIEGGNHAQFGWYGSQPGDGAAAISREEQQAQLLAGARAVMQSVAGPRLN